MRNFIEMVDRNNSVWIISTSHIVAVTFDGLGAIYHLESGIVIETYTKKRDVRSNLEVPYAFD